MNNVEIETSDGPLSAIPRSRTRLRHTAVHCQKIAALEVQLFLKDVEPIQGLVDDKDSAKDISNIHHSLPDHVKGVSVLSSSSQERLETTMREKLMQIFIRQLEEHSAVSQIVAENHDFERDATARSQQNTL